VAAKLSAGLLLHRRAAGGELEVLLVHPGGPFWARRDEGAWSIPKGEVEAGEQPLAVARRELEEELGQPAPDGDPFELGEVRQAGGKRVVAWGLEADLDVSAIESDTFEIEWPPRSGRMREFPEVDRAEWCDLATARRRLNPAQARLLDALVRAAG
jgi:predicted NUDIX family NTP pyrophosphohydrolase